MMLCKKGFITVLSDTILVVSYHGMSLWGGDNGNACVSDMDADNWA